MSSTPPLPEEITPAQVPEQMVAALNFLNETLPGMAQSPGRDPVGQGVQSALKTLWLFPGNVPITASPQDPWVCWRLSDASDHTPVIRYEDLHGSGVSVIFDQASRPVFICWENPRDQFLCFLSVSGQGGEPCLCMETPEKRQTFPISASATRGWVEAPVNLTQSLPVSGVSLAAAPVSLLREKLKSVRTSPQKVKKFCRHCGAECTKASKFCPQCGKPRSEESHVPV